MQRTLRVLCVVFLIVGCGLAQQKLVTITASAISDPAGNPVQNGTWKFQPTDCKSNPLQFHIGGGGFAIARPVVGVITNGASTQQVNGQTLQLADTSQTSPVNACYDVTITDTQTMHQYPVIKNVQPAYSNSWCTNGVCNWDNFSPYIATLPTYSTGTGVGGNIPPYIQDFSNASVVSMPASSHRFSTRGLIVSCYDTSLSSNALYQIPSQISLNPTTYDVTVAFFGPHTGYCLVNGGTGPAGTSQVLTGYATQTWVTQQLNKNRPCEIHVGGSGANGVLQSTDGDFANCVNLSGATLAVTSLQCFSDNTGTTTVQLATSGGTNLLSSAVTCSPTGGSGTLNGSPSQAAGVWLAKPTITPDGTTKTLVIAIGRTL